MNAKESKEIQKEISEVFEKHNLGFLETSEIIETFNKRMYDVRMNRLRIGDKPVNRKTRRAFNL